MEIRDKNSMLYWWRYLRNLADIPKPKTVVIELEDEFIEMFFNCVESLSRPECNSVRENIKGINELIREAVNLVGGYPVFLRSDYTSGKHGSLLSDPLYRIGSEKDLWKVWTLIYECHEPIPVHVFNPPRPHAIVIREWLEISKWTDVLKGFYGNIEVRVFVEKGRVKKVYPYYHWSGLERMRVENIDKLKKQYVESYVTTIINGLDKILRYATRIAITDKLIEDSWSIDFAYARGDWYFIDMALAEASWKPRKETDEDILIQERVSQILENLSLF